MILCRMSKVEQEKTDKMLIKSLEREERERKRVCTALHLCSGHAVIYII